MKDPLPTTAKRVDNVENTLFLMEILRDKKKKENEEKKVNCTHNKILPATIY